MISLVEKKPYKFSGSGVVDNKLTIHWGWEKIDELGQYPVIAAIMLKRTDRTEHI
jgi:hypothetical protein